MKESICFENMLREDLVEGGGSREIFTHFAA